MRSQALGAVSGGLTVKTVKQANQHKNINFLVDNAFNNKGREKNSNTEGKCPGIDLGYPGSRQPWKSTHSLNLEGALHLPLGNDSLWAFFTPAIPIAIVMS